MSIFHYYGILPSYNRKLLKKSKASKDRDIHPAICLIGIFNPSKEAQQGLLGWRKFHILPVKMVPWEQKWYVDKYFLNTE